MLHLAVVVVNANQDWWTVNGTTISCWRANKIDKIKRAWGCLTEKKEQWHVRLTFTQIFVRLTVHCFLIITKVTWCVAYTEIRENKRRIKRMFAGSCWQMKKKKREIIIIKKKMNGWKRNEKLKSLTSPSPYFIFKPRCNAAITASNFNAMQCNH
jgi:hypothetical protein